MRSRSHDIGCFNDSIALKFDRHLESTAAEVLVKFQSDRKGLNPNLAASSFTRSYGKTPCRLMDRGPGCGLIPILVDARVKPGALYINTGSTHLRRVTHICISKLCHHCTRLWLFVTGPVGTHSNEILFNISKLSNKHINCLPFCAIAMLCFIVCSPE